MTLLEEIANWKLEAKLESSEKYFYHTNAIDRLSQGHRSFVIGRKGTGKTAICEYLATKKSPKYFAQKLTFKNFPFNRLYSLNDKGYTSPNQYITLWKYLIYSTTCKLLHKNPDVDIASREKLEPLFNVDISHALPNAVERWTDVNFELKILGTGAAFGRTKGMAGEVALELGEKVQILEEFIRGRLGASTYVILFDELDEDFKDIVNPDKYRQYTELLTSLFKAIQDVRSVFREWKLYPIVFLRDDIYDVLQDPDKTKWSDYKLELSWDSQGIKNLLAFRISRAINPAGKPLDFGQAWLRVFDSTDVFHGHRKTVRSSAFEYITRSTQMRPRDFIRYLQVCAEQAIDHNLTLITPEIVRSEDKSFSNYLRSELEDEIHGIIPEIKRILILFSERRKQALHIDEFLSMHKELVDLKELPSRDGRFILQVLFHFSVIGNVPRQSNHAVFRYLNNEARLNMSEKICVHRGLFKSLQIL
ncbi:MAG TPA: hypothetical protein VMF52_18850 [Steroidobacteraceae bacterium]|nr:hypothetical protein [Steroidobacteraceae bacterium]